MFAPSRDDVRRFFADAWRKHGAHAPILPMETLAVDIVLAHPEYQSLLDSPEAAMAAEFTVEHGGINPFLHMSLHLAVEEQLSIDQPRGLKKEFARILACSGDRHAALHALLDCLGETVWRAQRDGAPPDSLAYLECVRKR